MTKGTQYCDTCETVLINGSFCPQCRSYAMKKTPRVRYSLKRDHTEIKRDIKKWELEIDELIARLYAMKSHKAHIIASELDEITGQMMAVNI